jgi:outer membrane protein assembly factor BamB
LKTSPDKGKKMRNAAKLAIVLALLTLTSCSTLKNMFSRGSKRDVPAKLVDFKQTMNVRTQWKDSVGKAGGYVFSPSLSDGNLYVASADGTIERIDPENGHVEWKIHAGMPLSAGVGSNINTVAVAGEKGKVLAFDINGKLRWQAQASSEVISPPAVAMGLVIVHSVDNRIAAFDIESGARRWVEQRTVPPLTLRAPAGITVAGPLGFIAMPGGKLLALSLENGSSVWEAVVGIPRGATELERLADTVGFPVIVGSDVCAVAYQGRVACFDGASGTPRWTKPLSSDVGLGADERFIFASDADGAVNAFSRELGASMWRNDKLAHRRLSAPVSFGRSVAVGDFQGYVHFLSREDGGFLARVSTDGSAISGVPVVAGNNLIVQTRSGAVVALAIE